MRACESHTETENRQWKEKWWGIGRGGKRGGAESREASEARDAGRRARRRADAQTLGWSAASVDDTAGFNAMGEK